MLAKTIPPLTGIRGVAAILVLLHHCAGSTPLLRNGEFGVDLFFLLSGFILYHVHGGEFSKLSWPAATDFYLSRFLRVYPLHFVVMMVIVGVLFTFPDFASWMMTTGPVGLDGYSIASFLQTLTLTNRVGFPDLGNWNGPSWSLSSEVLGYLFFPLLAFIALRVKSLKLCLAFCTTSIILHSLATYTNHNGVARVLLTFPAGMVVARAAHISQPSTKSVSLVATIASIWVLVSLAIDALAPLSVFGFVALIYALSFNEGRIAQLFSSRAAMFLGLISFSVYLTHWFLACFASWAADNRLPSVVLVPVALGLGWATYHLVEAPSHRFSRKVAANRKYQSSHLLAPTV